MKTKSRRLIMPASAALLAGAAVPATALDLSAGGVSVSSGSSSGGGTSVSTGTGGTATLGGGSNIASVGTGAGSVSVGNTNGNLVSLNGTDASVNLGGLGLGSGVNNTLNGVTGPLGTTFDGVNTGGPPGTGGQPPGGGGIAGARVAAAFGGLSIADQQQIRLKCRAVLTSPSSFNAETVALCRLLARR